jgi:hypothetical protein
LPGRLVRDAGLKECRDVLAGLIGSAFSLDRMLSDHRGRCFGAVVVVLARHGADVVAATRAAPAEARGTRCWQAGTGRTSAHHELSCSNDGRHGCGCRRVPLRRSKGSDRAVVWGSPRRRERSSVPAPISRLYRIAERQRICSRRRMSATINTLPDDASLLKAMLIAERARNDRLLQIIKELRLHRFGRRAESLPED